MRPPAVRRERVRFRPSGMARSGRRSAAHEKLSSGGPAAESGKGADARLGMTLRRRKAFAGRQEILMRKALLGTAGRCRRGASFETEPLLCGSRNACGRLPWAAAGAVGAAMFFRKKLIAAIDFSVEKRYTIDGSVFRN